MATLLGTLTLSLACGGKGDAGSEDAGVAGSTAASATQAADDLADITKYRLTMDKVDRFIAAQRNLGQRMAALSADERARLKAEDDAEDEGDDADGANEDNDQSLDGMTRKIESEPMMVAAIRDAGLSPREYVTITMAVMQAGMATAVLKMRPNDDQDSLAREMKVNPANIAFMRANEAEITRKTQQVAAEMKRLGVE